MNETDRQIELFREDYTLTERVSAKARNIRIEVRPDRSVSLIYPRWVARAEAVAFFRTREAWVRSKLLELALQSSAHPAPARLRWDGSDRLLLRGRELPLRLEAARLRRAAVRFETDRVVVLAAPADGQTAKLDVALRQALIHKARLDARTHLDAAAAPLGVVYRELRINDPQTQWGSCNPGAVICLSWRLVMAPVEVFRYVAVHELCHLMHMDHSSRFWALVERQMPDFEQHKRWLRDRGHQLHGWLMRD
ncbi:M48 family metallopeptidase [Solimonas terrae]|uniref:M48 family metallopeptidase n=1 Tax=Solimonas terrae TaxID=1396819 RepID=A0A6M2BSQ7_9GAMM|nr:SprT family zinc-dependent metalloprotease [Solimonas terrae]NGY05027.1 M48 family metallopeptidase [Solimonas terrae]